MLNDITWPEAIIILGVLLLLGFSMVCAVMVVMIRSEGREDKN